MGLLARSLNRIFSKLQPGDDVHIPPGVSVGRHTYGYKSDTFLLFPGSDRVELGKFCSIGTGARIFCGGEHRTDLVTTYPLKTLVTRVDGKNYDAITKGPTIIGNDVWIGAGAIILSGVKIGDGAVIGAGSVVASDIPPYAVVSGNPAKVMRLRFSPSEIERLVKLSWWNWDDDTIKAREQDFYGEVAVFLDKYSKKTQ